MGRIRREFLKFAASFPLWISGAGRAMAEEPQLPEGARQSAPLEALPGKVPLIKRTWRPPNFETPVELLDAPYTPNDAFFVRYHLAGIPLLNTTDWRLTIGGDGLTAPYVLDWESLHRDFASVELSALCLCSGNRRGYSQPHVPGIQWGHGAMGNARWKGVRLKDILARAGLRKEALEVGFDGADTPALEGTPDFTKSLPLWKALDENTLLAFEMNGAPLPHWNGHPVRLVVPGWTATYWIKHLTRIDVSTQSAKGFWMATAYRVPKGRFPVIDRFVSQENESSTPITEMVVSSLITQPRAEAKLSAREPALVQGLAWDGGYGIDEVLVSMDGGETWRRAELGPDLGRFAWRQWRLVRAPAKPGPAVIMARASNRQGATQTPSLVFNPAGYHNNVIQRIPVEFL